MLVLSRKVGQSVVIGDVTVTLLRKKGRIRLGIEAPAGIHIMRPEANTKDARLLSQSEFLPPKPPYSPPTRWLSGLDRPAASGHWEPCYERPNSAR